MIIFDFTGAECNARCAGRMTSEERAAYIAPSNEQRDEENFRRYYRANKARYEQRHRTNYHARRTLGMTRDQAKYLGPWDEFRERRNTVLEARKSPTKGNHYDQPK
ncbi:MAG: hypothetical protein AAGC71_18485 [Pseudomonadota bacterium]